MDAIGNNKLKTNRYIIIIHDSKESKKPYKGL